MTELVETVTVTQPDVDRHPRPARPRRRIDLGRLTFVPLAVLLLAISVGAAGSAVQALVASEPGALSRLVIQLLTGTFYVLIIVLYLRRGEARATTRSLPAKVGAVAGCWLPLALPMVAPGTQDPRLLTLANVLLIGGMAGAVWSLRTLGRSFSVLPQARALVTTGPYSAVRHPLYLFELIAGLGLVAAHPGVWTAAVWVAILALQMYRTVHEEAVLEATLPAYAEYRLGTSRLVPGLF